VTFRFELVQLLNAYTCTECGWCTPVSSTK
jgi:hypothetical protein